MTDTAEIRDLNCLVYAPISWSKSDTPETIKEVKIHNAVHKSVCRS